MKQATSSRRWHLGRLDAWGRTPGRESRSDALVPGVHSGNPTVPPRSRFGSRLLAAAIILLAVASFARQACGQTAKTGAASTSHRVDLQAIAKTLRENLTPEDATALLPVLAGAVYDETPAALPLLEQALQQALPRAVETQSWPLVAESLKTAARARFKQIETEQAGRHLQTLLALYRDVAGARRRDVDGPWRWLRQIHEVAAEYLRGEQTGDALAVLAEGADLNLPYREELDDGRAALAGALHRRLAQRTAEERYELLYQWTMPGESRRALRVFSSLAPVEAPPATFARALGERPRSDSFPVAQIGGVPGLFSTLWSLVSAAAETGRLRRLTAELQTAADEQLPHAELALLLAQIAAADQAQIDRLAAASLNYVNPPVEAPPADKAQAPGASDRLSALLLAAACLSREPSTSIGESILNALLESAPQRDPQRLAPRLQRAWSAPILKRFPGFSSQRLGDPNLELWLPTSYESADDAARGATGPVWLAHEEHILHLAGARHDYLCFRYPLSGDFEFHVEVQDGGHSGGGLALGGLTFAADGRSLTARLGALDLVKERLKLFPFIRQEAWPAFQRLEIRSTGDVVQFRCNGHPAWSEMPGDSASPWLALRCGSDRVTAFRGLRIVGQPVVPRQVRLCKGNALRGWFSHYYPAAVSTALPLAGSPAAAERAPKNGFDWYAKEGVIYGAHRAGGSTALPSRLSYFRPLDNGETLDYEFFYEPGQIAVHPALGRLAFLLDEGGVQLHWLTTGVNEWTGLDQNNSIVEPLNRRGPKPLPLKIGEWNRVTIALAKDTATISLNDGVIYVRKLEREHPRTFSFYHDRRQSGARIRNIVLRGDWPEQLTEQHLANLTAPRDAARASSDRRALGELFADRHVPESALFVHRRATALPLETRYKRLAEWVLPGEDHAGLRLALDFTPTHLAPPVTDDDPLDAQRVANAAKSGKSRIQTGGNLVAPALDLVAAARQLGKLDELRRRVEQAPQTDDWSRRARLAMLAIVDMAHEQPQAAIESLDKLFTLVEAGDHTEFAERWPETLAAHAALLNPATRNSGRDLAYHLLLRQVRGGPDGGSEAWRRQMGALARLAQFSETEAGKGELKRFDFEPEASQWRPGSRTTAQTRGLGYPLHRWRLADGRAAHLASHDRDCLYFQSPLRGDFEVECDIPRVFWRDMQLVVGGWWTSLIYDFKSYVYGNYQKELPRQPLDPEMTRVGTTIHARTVVRQGVSRSYVNGRLLHEQPLSTQCDPWIALRNLERLASDAQNVRITGRPNIPTELRLTGQQDLTGWFPYYEGMPGSPDAWQLQGPFSADAAIAGARTRELEGSFAESLLRYHRPMFEDGTIEYEFFYREGEIDCHPALDRLAFLIAPAGVRIHWITDGVYDRTTLPADNAFDEPACRRGPERLPLESDAWNRLALELKVNVVRLRLNGRLVYERPVERTNQRTFGLFHYADQTEALVRRATWQGDWPRELPPVSQQDLAGAYGDFLDARLAKLPAKFEHDFARDGLPAERFSITPHGMEETLSVQPDGLHVAFSGTTGFRTVAAAPQMKVGGDFDAIISYERFQTEPTEGCAISLVLQATMDNPAADQCMWYRRATGRADGSSDQRLLALTARRTANRVRHTLAANEPFEAPSGRLRLARRGDTIYFLSAEGDSPNFRLIHSKRMAADDLTIGGLRFLTQTKEPSRVDVLWKKLTVFAERLSGPAVEDTTAIVAELDRQRQTLAGSFVHDFTRDELTSERFHCWRFDPRATPPPSGLRIVAQGAGETPAASISPHLSLHGDFDVSAEIDQVRFDAPKQGKNSGVYLQLDVPGEAGLQCSVILLEQDDGWREVLGQLRRKKDDGSFEYPSYRYALTQPLRRMRLARRGKQILFLYSSDLSKPDCLLARFDASDADIADAGLRLAVRAGGAGRSGEVGVKKLSVLAERVTFSPTQAAGAGN